jgi:hypothetical protein
LAILGSKDILESCAFVALMLVNLWALNQTKY